MKQIWVLNGPNLNLLGEREPGIYGTQRLQDLCHHLQEVGKRYSIQVVCKQSNHEGVLIDWIHEARDRADALILNPGGLSHTSIALLDALRVFPGPVMEVHLSNLWRREPYRHILRTAAGATGVIAGLGPLSYELALHAIAHIFESQSSKQTSVKRGQGHEEDVYP